MWPNPQGAADLAMSAKEILNWKLPFLCSANQWTSASLDSH